MKSLLEVILEDIFQRSPDSQYVNIVINFFSLDLLFFIFFMVGNNILIDLWELFG